MTNRIPSFDPWFKRGLKSKLAVRQLGFILLFSSLITLVLASVQIIMEYRADIGDIRRQLDQVGEGYVLSLSSSLWKLDDDQIRVELMDALSHRDIVYLEIREAGHVLFSAGKRPDGPARISKGFQLGYRHRGEVKPLGTLMAVASLEGTYERMLKRVVYILVTQGVKTFLVSFFILYIIHRLVIRHLVDLARYARRIDFSRTGTPDGGFLLDRKTLGGQTDDELDDLVRAVNEMRERVIKDMEARRIREAEKAKLEQRLKQSQKMEALGTLAGGFAHQFNNMLFPILGNAELLKEDMPRGGECDAYVEEILAAGRRARDLVRQILIFTRSQQKTEKAPVSVQPVLHAVLTDLQSNIPHDVRLETEIDDNCPGVRLDHGQVRQVVMNLCENAMEAMAGGGGVLGVSLSRIVLDQDLDMEDGLSKSLVPGLYVCLCISDTGSGMDNEVVKKIFDPFFTTDRVQNKTGLGLSLVHGIVTGCGGEVRVESSPGRGSRFEVYLPAEEGDNSS